MDKSNIIKWFYIKYFVNPLIRAKYQIVNWYKPNILENINKRNLKMYVNMYKL